MLQACGLQTGDASATTEDRIEADLALLSHWSADLGNDVPWLLDVFHVLHTIWVLLTFAAALDSPRSSTGGNPNALTLNVPLCCSTPSATTMQFSAFQAKKTLSTCPLLSMAYISVCKLPRPSLLGRFSYDIVSKTASELQSCITSLTESLTAQKSANAQICQQHGALLRELALYLGHD